MNKTKLCTMNETIEVMDAIMAVIKKSLKEDDVATLVSLGTLGVSKRKASKGRNPQTGEAIKIAAKKVPVFKAGKTLKDAVK